MLKKEELLELGLTEEQAEKVVNKATEVMKGYIPKARFDEVNNLKNEYQKQLEELQKSTANVEELKKQLQQVNEVMKQKEQEYEARIKDLQVDAAIKLALTGKVHDVDIVAGLIDKSKLEFDESGNITKGLDEQIQTLKETKAFLFKQEEQPQEPQVQQPQSLYQALGFKFPKIGAEPASPPAPKGPSNLQEAVAEAMFGSAQGTIKTK